MGQTIKATGLSFCHTFTRWNVNSSFYLLMVRKFQSECPALVRVGLYIWRREQELIVVYSRNMRCALFVCTIHVLLTRNLMYLTLFY